VGWATHVYRLRVVDLDDYLKIWLRKVRRELTDEQRALRDPKWVSPSVVYLASEEAHDITGRVIQTGFGRIAVCEGWRRGAEVNQVADRPARCCGK